MACAPHPLTCHPKAIKSWLPLDFLVQLQHCLPEWELEGHMQVMRLSLLSLIWSPGRQQASLRSGSSPHIRPCVYFRRPSPIPVTHLFLMEVVLVQGVGGVNLGDTSKLEEASSSLLFHPPCTAASLLLHRVPGKGRQSQHWAPHPRACDGRGCFSLEIKQRADGYWGKHQHFSLLLVLTFCLTLCDIQHWAVFWFMLVWPGEVRLSPAFT